MNYELWLEQADPRGGPVRMVSAVAGVDLACAAMFYEAMPGGLLPLDRINAMEAARHIGYAVVQMESQPGKFRRMNTDGNFSRYETALSLLHRFMQDCQDHGFATMRVTVQ